MPLVRQVRIGVLSTGDELVEIDAPEPLAAGKIRNSNQVMLCGLAEELAGAGNVRDLGNCPDDRGRLRAALESGMGGSDLLVVCGGMSMGTRDLVPPMLKEMGVEMHVEKVRIKPGKPFIFGTKVEGGRRKYVAGLPGNPVSSYVTFQRFVREIVGRMLGSEGAPRLKKMRARVDRELEENGDREFYMPCAVRREGQGAVAEVLSWKGSADIFTLARADGLIVRASGAEGVEAGGEVEVLAWGSA
jgi:molybdopterin molybdotransferase